MENSLFTFEVVGPESSGKTTLVKELAAYFETSFSEEFSRQYLEQLGKPYQPHDLEQIAFGQLDLNNEAKENANKISFFDTGMITIKLWQEIKYGIENEQINQLFINNLPNCYLLCYPDLQWEYDPLREAADFESRLKIFNEHKRLIEQINIPYFVVKGEKRLDESIDFIKFTLLN